MVIFFYALCQKLEFNLPFFEIVAIINVLTSVVFPIWNLKYFECGFLSFINRERPFNVNVKLLAFSNAPDYP